MRQTQSLIVVLLLSSVTACARPDQEISKNVERPEEIRSMREVVFDHDTYVKLAGLWKAYCREYPSEYAYANWMYAARYAGDSLYPALLDKGLKKYPANPTLLYLKGLEHCGAHDNVEGRAYLEKAATLNERFADPWFALIPNYMDAGDNEKVDMALRHLLENGAVADAVLDYNHNLLTGLEENAILITNGDNDTFPGWILTRILHIRSDVAIINRSLLNADWYPGYVIRQGLPPFTTPEELSQMRQRIMERLRGSEVWRVATPGGPFGDSLILKIVASAERAGRPVYLSRTLGIEGDLAALAAQGRDLGLAILVTTSKRSYAEQLQSVYREWTEGFRTGGLDSWRLRYAPATDAGRLLVPNYSQALAACLPSLKEHAPGLRLELFHWYRAHVEGHLDQQEQYRIARQWEVHAADIREIGEWCESQGLE